MFRPVIISLLLALPAASLQAGGIVRDDMTGYISGLNTNKGIGWSGHWHAGPETLVTPRADDPAPRLEIEGGNTVRALTRRLLKPIGVGGQPVYFRSDFSIEGSIADANRLFVGWNFADASGYNHALPTAILSVQGRAGARISNESANEQGDVIQPGGRHTLVAKLDGWDDRAKRFKTIKVWLDPNPAQGEAEQSGQIADSATTPDEGVGPVELLFLRTYNLGDARLHLYRVAFATSWHDCLKN